MKIKLLVIYAILIASISPVLAANNHDVIQLLHNKWQHQPHKLLTNKMSQSSIQWVPLNGPAPQIMGVLATDDKHFFAINDVVDNNTALFRSEDGGQSWETAYADHATHIVQFNNQLVLAAGNSYILTSQDNGKTWQIAYRFGDESWTGGLSAQNNVLILTRGNGLYLSTDSTHWQKFYDFTNWDNHPTAYATDATHIYLDTNDALQYSSDQGKTWTKLLDFWLPGYQTPHSAIFGYQSKVLIVAFQEPFQEMRILKSIDGGHRWEDISNIDMPTIDFNFTAFNVIDENTYYFATDHGDVFLTQNGGENWAPENTGLENNIVLSLFTSQQGLLLAGTKANGVFRGTHTPQ